MNPCEDCHRPVGVHCCHNCKKDANKCNEYHSCGSCDAWEQGIFTNADRIRSMSDEELAELFGAILREREIILLKQLEKQGIEASIVELPDETFNAHLEWLKQPVEG